MMRRNALIMVVSLVAASFSLGQESSVGSIRGSVVDDSTGTPVMNANVFLVNTTKGTATDTVGSFEIRNVASGAYELVASCVGYRMESRRIRIESDAAGRIELRLRPILIVMKSVDVTAPLPEAWKRSLEQFKVLLLGSTDEAKLCQILNPEALEFHSDRESRLSARADKELVVLNPLLGYRIHVSIVSFQMDGGWLSCDWKSRFEELTPVGSQDAKEWKRNRERVFRGSMHHFLISLIRGNYAREGFVMLGSTTPRFEQKKKDLYFEKSASDILKRVSPDEWEIQFADFLIVQNENISVDVFGGHSGLSHRAMTSTLALTGRSLHVDSHGQMLDRLPVKVSGDWGKDGLANEVPIDFSPDLER
jgi:hypothetical protein